jgi:hypothetical protein
VSIAPISGLRQLAIHGAREVTVQVLQGMRQRDGLLRPRRDGGGVRGPNRATTSFPLVRSEDGWLWEASTQRVIRPRRGTMLVPACQDHGLIGQDLRYPIPSASFRTDGNHVLARFGRGQAAPCRRPGRPRSSTALTSRRANKKRYRTCTPKAGWNEHIDARVS